MMLLIFSEEMIFHICLKQILIPEKHNSPDAASESTSQQHLDLHVKYEVSEAPPGLLYSSGSATTFNLVQYHHNNVKLCFFYYSI